ncbi:MAG: carboxylating nicotinate-nucleotide diphosphorylase [bacterium]|nr:carboxylating nicotinate-nucleotide diphosphorylase [bacterium]
MPELDPGRLEQAIELALAEDVGDGDVTTLWTLRENATARAELIAKAPGVVAGLDVARAVFFRVDPDISFQAKVKDGARVAAQEVLAEVSGPARGILTAERTALNFLQRMCGIATMTAAYVDAVVGTGACILDTRKTAPGLRMLDKYAVAAGGGRNHRIGLFDMVLLKENHIEAADGIGPAVARVKAAMGQAGRSVKVEVEVKDLQELEDAIVAGADRIMLDNMEAGMMRRAVERVKRIGEGRPELEASGNVTLETVRGVAETGVDLISIGALTHSVRALDLSLLFRR